MGEYEDGYVESRVVAPPLRVLVHSPPEHDCPDVSECFVENFAVAIALAAGKAVGLAPARETVDPFVQAFTALAQPQLRTIVWPRDESIQGHRNIDSDLSHQSSFGSDGHGGRRGWNAEDVDEALQKRGVAGEQDLATLD